MDEQVERILVDNKFEASKNKPGLYRRDYGDIVIFADFREKQMKFYGYMGNHPAPKWEVENRVMRVKMAIEVLVKRQSRLY